MNNSDKINVLWLDDDLYPITEGVTEGRQRLQPWLRWFKQNNQYINLIEARTIQKFVEILKERAEFKIDNPAYLHILLIDVMWRNCRDLPSSFADVGYDKTKIVPMEAGMQLIGLIRWSKDTGVKWLEKYADRDIVALTTLTDSIGSIQEHVGRGLNEKKQELGVIHKNLDINYEGLAVPSKEFTEYFQQKIKASGQK